MKNLIYKINWKLSQYSSSVSLIFGLLSLLLSVAAFYFSTQAFKREKLEFENKGKFLCETEYTVLDNKIIGIKFNSKNSDLVLENFTVNIPGFDSNTDFSTLRSSGNRIYIKPIMETLEDNGIWNIGPLFSQTLLGEINKYELEIPIIVNFNVISKQGKLIFPMSYNLNIVVYSSKGIKFNSLIFDGQLDNGSDINAALFNNRLNSSSFVIRHNALLSNYASNELLKFPNASRAYIKLVNAPQRVEIDSIGNVQLAGGNENELMKFVNLADNSAHFSEILLKERTIPFIYSDPKVFNYYLKFLDSTISKLPDNATEFRTALIEIKENIAPNQNLTLSNKGRVLISDSIDNQELFHEAVSALFNEREKIK